MQFHQLVLAIFAPQAHKPFVHPEGPCEHPVVTKVHAGHANVQDHDVAGLIQGHQVASQVPLLLLVLGCELLDLVTAALAVQAQAAFQEERCELRGRLGEAADGPRLARAHQRPRSCGLRSLVCHVQVTATVATLATACYKVPADPVVFQRLGCVVIAAFSLLLCLFVRQRLLVLLEDLVILLLLRFLILQLVVLLPLKGLCLRGGTCQGSKARKAWGRPGCGRLLLVCLFIFLQGLLVQLLLLLLGLLAGTVQLRLETGFWWDVAGLRGILGRHHGAGAQTLGHHRMLQRRLQLAGLGGGCLTALLLSSLPGQHALDQLHCCLPRGRGVVRLILPRHVVVAPGLVRLGPLLGVLLRRGVTVLGASVGPGRRILLFPLLLWLLLRRIGAVLQGVQQ
mmetsp:Transcript_122502/g.341429  ORF Transcript_122502/g.341429 Transcript_122502/m.341429 type:complete len:396 (-) Transcript_122502:33-1220(-)